jgi:hypothetical protein
MNKIKPALAIFLSTVAFNCIAADWNMVGATAEEQVFIDSQSINTKRDGLLQVRVLENFAKTNEEMGEGVYEHKSRVMLLAVDCRLGAVSYEQWSLHADALGTGATVWADSMQNGPAFFRPDRQSGYGHVVRQVCSSAMAGSN